MSVLVTRNAPDFIAPAAMPDGTINEQFQLSSYRDKHVLLFFWPLDFTFVCPTEIIALDHRFETFADQGVQLIGVSIDSQFTHHAWRRTPIEQGGIGPVKFPIVADVKHGIARDYGVEHPDEGVAMRASFLIDKEGIVQHMTVNNLPLGRNIDEHLRMVEALCFVEEYGEVCPAGWCKGDSGLKPTTEGVADYLTSHSREL